MIICRFSEEENPRAMLTPLSLPGRLRSIVFSAAVQLPISYGFLRSSEKIGIDAFKG
jgi:hypothetical protein